MRHIEKWCLSSSEISVVAISYMFAPLPQTFPNVSPTASSVCYGLPLFHAAFLPLSHFRSYASGLPYQFVSHQLMIATHISMSTSFAFNVGDNSL